MPLRQYTWSWLFTAVRQIWRQSSCSCLIALRLVSNMAVIRYTIMFCKTFLPRDAIHAWPMPSSSVRPSVTFVPSCTLPKRINVSSKFFQHQAVTPFQFSTPNVMALFRRERGVECRWGRHKSRFWTSGWLSIDDRWSQFDPQLIVVCAVRVVYHSYGARLWHRDRHASVNTPKTREHNRCTQRYCGKSEVEVSRRLRSCTYYTIKANY